MPTAAAPKPVSEEMPTIPIDASTTTDDTPHPGFFIQDEINHHTFLVDTGAFMSIFPAAKHEKNDLPSSCVRLIAANGTTISTYGQRELTLRFHGQTYSWSFILADVQRPLLGADFLSHHHLMVDVARQQLIDNDSFRPLPLCRCPIAQISEVAGFKPADGRYHQLIEEFPDVLKPVLKQTPGTAAKHGVYHHIKTEGPPAHARFRRLRPDRLQAAKRAFAEMERMGVCSKAASP